MSKKLTYRIKRWGSTVMFQLLYMDERFRESSRFKSSNGFNVISLNCPEITNSDIYLQGSDKFKDNIFSTYNCSTEKEAEDYIEKVHSALDDWAKNWEGWGESKQTESDSDIDIYEV